MNANTRMLELATRWRELHPQATEQQQKDAFDKIAGHVVHEIMRGYEIHIDLGALG